MVFYETAAQKSSLPEMRSTAEWPVQEHKRASHSRLAFRTLRIRSRVTRFSHIVPLTSAPGDVSPKSQKFPVQKKDLQTRVPKKSRAIPVPEILKGSIGPLGDYRTESSEAGWRRQSEHILADVAGHCLVSVCMSVG
jgi:hypothetical protein